MPCPNVLSVMYTAGDTGAGEDKRRDARFQLPMMAKISGEFPAASRLIDISDRGARVATRQKVNVGESVGIEVYLQETDPFPIRLVGECRWTRPVENNEIIAGLDLSGSHSRNLNVLKRFLSDLFQ